MTYTTRLDGKSLYVLFAPSRRWVRLPERITQFWLRLPSASTPFRISRSVGAGRRGADRRHLNDAGTGIDIPSAGQEPTVSIF